MKFTKTAKTAFAFIAVAVMIAVPMTALLQDSSSDAGTVTEGKAAEYIKLKDGKTLNKDTPFAILDTLGVAEDIWDSIGLDDEYFAINVDELTVDSYSVGKGSMIEKLKKSDCSIETMKGTAKFTATLINLYNGMKVREIITDSLVMDAGADLAKYLGKDTLETGDYFTVECKFELKKSTRESAEYIKVTDDKLVDNKSTSKTSTTSWVEGTLKFNDKTVKVKSDCQIGIELTSDYKATSSTKLGDVMKDALIYADVYGRTSIKFDMNGEKEYSDAVVDVLSRSLNDAMWMAQRNTQRSYFTEEMSDITIHNWTIPEMFPTMTKEVLENTYNMEVTEGDYKAVEDHTFTVQDSNAKSPTVYIIAAVAGVVLIAGVIFVVVGKK